MGAFIVIAVVMISAAVLADAGTTLAPINSDRVPPLPPENLALYETIGSDEFTRGSDEEPDSCTTVQHRLIALGH